MTGWRIGWMVLPEELIRPVERPRAELLHLAARHLATRRHRRLRRRCRARSGEGRLCRHRKLLLARLPAIGFDDYMPVDGAFYVYASVRRFSNDSIEFTGRMLAEAGVAATPGPDFDRARGHAWARFSFAGTEADMAEAMDRLQQWLK